MLRKILISLHKKPKHVRANYALGFAVLFTGLVSTVWFFSMGNGTVFLVSEVGSEEKEGGSPFSGLFKESKEYFANVKSSFQSDELDDNLKDKNETNDGEKIDLNKQNINQETDTTFENNGQYHFSPESTATTTNSFASSTSFATSSEITSGEYKQNYQEVQIVTVSNEPAGTTTATSTDFRQ